MTAAFVALSLGLAIHSVGQDPGNAPQTAHAAAAASAPYYMPQQNGLASVPYYYPYQKKHLFHHHDYILPPGPGDGWGFPNGFPDGYGWADYGPYLPLNADRTADYYFPRYYVVPPEQMFFPSFYNPYETRGQRYLPYVADGGAHPAGGAPLGLGRPAGPAVRVDARPDAVRPRAAAQRPRRGAITSPRGPRG